ncbi:MAG: glycosyltransferase family 4 protein [Actinomycetia bacterium]|nr:glycosyltransferase family 4 protein [Actinomycetes bacterium]
MSEQPRSEQRVLLLIATTTGGTGRHVRVLVSALAERGWGVTVAGPRRTEELFGFTETGAAFVPAEIGTRPSPESARALRIVRRLARDNDVVHAHSLRAGAIAALATPRTRPLVVTWHNAVLAQGNARTAYGLLERLVARRATATLCVSSDLVDRVRELGGRDVQLAPVSAPAMPAPLRDRDAVRAELGVTDRPIVLSVGRLHAQKGFGDLVAAATRLSGHEPRPLFVIAGDGPARSDLERSIAEADAPVRLLGDRPDIPDLLHATDLMALSSVWEGSPLAVSECLRAGVPFVGTAVGGVPDMVGDGGVLVPARDPAALADAIQCVLDSPELAEDLHTRALRAATRLPTDASVAEQVLATYSRVAGGDAQ